MSKYNKMLSAFYLFRTIEHDIENRIEELLYELNCVIADRDEAKYKMQYLAFCLYQVQVEQIVKKISDLRIRKEALDKGCYIEF